MSFQRYAKLLGKSVNQIKCLYDERKKLCLSQNYYVRKFITRKQKCYDVLTNHRLTLHYTSTFDSIAAEIVQLSRKDSFYIYDIEKLFIQDVKHVKLILEDYHCLYLKDGFDIIGFILFSTDTQEIIVQFLFIDSPYRCSGLGSFLLNMVEITTHYLCSMGLVKYKKGIISTYTYNPRMAKLLESFNYIKNDSHNNKNLQDHWYYYKSFWG